MLWIFNKYSRHFYALICAHRILLIAFILLFAKNSFTQRLYYIAETGSDIDGNGSTVSPFASLEYAAQFLKPGDTLIFKEGNYYNDTYGDGDMWAGDNYASITLNGTEEQPIVIMAYPGDDVRIHFDHTYGIQLINSSYVVIQDLGIVGIAQQIDEIEALASWGLYKDKNGLLHDLADELGIDPADMDLVGSSVDKPVMVDIEKPGYYNGRGLVVNKSQHIKLIDNRIFHATSSGLRIQQCDYVEATNNEVAFCTYWTSQGVGALTVAESKNLDANDDVKIILSRNRVHHNENKLVSWNPGKSFIKFVIDEGSGIFLTRNADTYQHGYYRIVNNLAYQNGARGIVVHKTNNVIVEHNSLFYNGANCTGAGAGIGVNSVSDVRIKNNLIHTRPDKWALGILAQPIAELSVTHNLLFNEFGEETLVNNIHSGWEQADPGYIDPFQGNLDLQGDSPAIDQALVEDNPLFDFHHNERSDGKPDIGAVEFQDISGSLGEGAINVPFIYPNPFSHSIRIKGKIKGDFISIFNENGVKVCEFRKSTEHLFNGKIDLEYLNEGVYFISFDHATYKIIKR
jgi:hypothetical protein